MRPKEEGNTCSLSNQLAFLVAKNILIGRKFDVHNEALLFLVFIFLYSFTYYHDDNKKPRGFLKK
jgi:hypothetical protein